ncbi:metallophosphoesterase [Microbacterium maritypicum]|uniref:antitoxin VbhA family protein n=1 Tax=Microbacterium maritypicum TaxID=33918 RepID=UPI003A94EF9A
MKALEHSNHIELPDQRVAVCGDWHGNVGWARMVSRALPYLAPDAKTMLHLGDWWMPPKTVDEVFSGTNIDRIYVTLGNHEQWDEITPLLEKHPGEAVRVSEITWLLPRPARLTIGGRAVLSLGGAASVDRESRARGAHLVAGRSDHRRARRRGYLRQPGGPHAHTRVPSRYTGAPCSEDPPPNPHGFRKAALEASSASRARVSQVWDAVRPELLAHGHLHVGAGGKTADGQRVASLGRDGHQGNLGILDMQSLRMTTPSLAILRGMANDGGPRRTREQRANSTAEALHSGVLDGLKPTPRAVRDAQDYIDGVRSLEEILEDVRQRHTRRPTEDEP